MSRFFALAGLVLGAVLVPSAALAAPPPVPSPPGTPADIPADIPAGVRAGIPAGIPAGIVWAPYRAQPQTVPAGLACTFPLHLEPVADDERTAVLASYPDGSPRVQVITGGLTVRFTDLDTGAALDRVLDGTGVLTTNADGSLVVQHFGAGGLGFRPTDPYPAGYYVLRGYHAFSVVVTSTGAVHRMLVAAGTEENLCPELA